jgi:hypothetical protein
MHCADVDPSCAAVERQFHDLKVAEIQVQRRPAVSSLRYKLSHYGPPLSG